MSLYNTFNKYIGHKTIFPKIPKKKTAKLLNLYINLILEHKFL